MAFVLIFFSLCMLGYLGYVLLMAWAFARLSCPRGDDPAAPFLPFVSVIIPARNEEASIEGCLRSLLCQRYPADRLELLLINDHSTDRTRALAEAFMGQAVSLRILDLGDYEGVAYKKAALSLGVGSARGSLILQTDADCVVSPGWVACMVQQFEEDVVFVSGPVQLIHRQGWLERLQSLESMGLVALGAGAMALGVPTMCNGANMAYRKAAFRAVGGHEGSDHVASGDDEFLMHKLHGAYPGGLRFAKCRDAIVRTPAVATWAELKAQRIRWVSKARAYTHRQANLVQLTFYLAFLGVLVLALLGAWWPLCWGILGAFFLLKLSVDLSLMLPAARFFFNLHLMRDFLLLQVLYVPYVLWIGIKGNVVQTYRWKEREVR